VHKQVYLYGGLDTSPTLLTRGFGMAWGVGGWLVMSFLQQSGPETVARLWTRVVQELTTTFASAYSREVSLTDMLTPEAFNAYTKKTTGEKFLVTPHATP
jgi:NADPH:quinone reductase